MQSVSAVNGRCALYRKASPSFILTLLLDPSGIVALGICDTRTFSSSVAVPTADCGWGFAKKKSSLRFVEFVAVFEARQVVAALLVILGFGKDARRQKGQVVIVRIVVPG